MIDGQSPIGVFDSGVGGLTVLRALRAALPDRRFIYLGDTARLPYGTKSPESVVRYSVQCAEALVARGIGCLVIACNTASGSALEALRTRYAHIPVIGVIEPGAAAAVAASRRGHVAVIGTEGTIGGGAYQTALRRLDPGVRVTARACSLFVAMAEEGWVGGPIAEAVAARYLDPIFLPGDTPDEGARGLPDTLVLGCTHFPVLTQAIRAVLPAGVAIVDSAAAVAAVVARAAGAPNAFEPGAAVPAADAHTACRLGAAVSGADGQTARRPGAAVPGAIGPDCAAPADDAHTSSESRLGNVQWLATDGAQRFARVSGIFLGTALRAEEIEIVDL